MSCLFELPHQSLSECNILLWFHHLSLSLSLVVIAVIIVLVVVLVVLVVVVFIAVAVVAIDVIEVNVRFPNFNLDGLLVRLTRNSFNHNIQCYIFV